MLTFTIIDYDFKTTNFSFIHVWRTKSVDSALGGGYSLPNLIRGITYGKWDINRVTCMF